MTMGTVERELPGVDLKDARTRLAEDLPFVLSLLHDYVVQAVETEKSLLFDAKRSDLEETLGKLHQLRGGAANLSAHRITRAVARLELLARGLFTRYKPDSPHSPATLREIATIRDELRQDLQILRSTLGTTPSLHPELEAQADSVGSKIQAQRSETKRRQFGPRALVIDDSDAMRAYLKATLEKGIENLEVIDTNDGLAGFRLLVEKAPDLVICDLQMPTFDGMKLLALRATRPDIAEIPFIMLTAEHEVDRKVEVLSRGASDYITKPFHAKELVARSRIHLGLKKLKDELREARVLLEELATTDEITGLSNRRHFESLLLDEVQRTAQFGCPTSIIIAQVRLFGDQDDEAFVAPMRALGLLLPDHLRPTDKPARISEDTFAVLLPHTQSREARSIAEHLRAELRDRGPSDGNRPGPMSFGVATAVDGAVSARELLKRATTACERAKKDRVQRVYCWPELGSV